MEPLRYKQEKSIGSSLDKVHTSEFSSVSGWDAAGMMSICRHCAVLASARPFTQDSNGLCFHLCSRSDIAHETDTQLAWGTRPCYAAHRLCTLKPAVA